MAGFNGSLEPDELSMAGGSQKEPRKVYHCARVYLSNCVRRNAMHGGDVIFAISFRGKQKKEGEQRSEREENSATELASR